MTSRTDRGAAVLGALRAAAPAAVSGEALASALGVSRVAVRKRVEALRAAGYVIDAASGVGYTLVETPDLPLPAEVAPLLRTPLWGELVGGGPTASTNDECKALAREGAPEGTVVLASEQTAGRGRLGRGWLSPPGGVYFSVVLRPALALADLVPLPLVVGVGLARGVGSLGARASLKWPNDVFLGEGKVAGVLVEMSAEAEAAEWVVAGCGVNVRRPPHAPDGAAYLAEAVPEDAVRLARVAAACLDGLAEAYADFLAGGFAAVREDFEARALLTGREVVVRDVRGVTVARGRVAGTDESGRLVVDGAGGRVAVAAGDVTLR